MTLSQKMKWERRMKLAKEWIDAIAAVTLAFLIVSVIAIIIL